MRVAVVFGQFGKAADPVNLPHFRDRLDEMGVETILVEHTDSKRVCDFLRGYHSFCGLAGSSLGAMAVVIMAGYLKPQRVDFVGGFQPSDWDPSGHTVNLKSGDDLITRAVTVPDNVKRAVCFRNPFPAGTGGLGHATYITDPTNTVTNLTVIERGDVHPGDFGVAQDIMIDEIRKRISW